MIHDTTDDRDQELRFSEPFDRYHQRTESIGITNTTMRIIGRTLICLLFTVVVAGFGCNPGYKREPEVLLQQLQAATSPSQLRQWTEKVSALKPDGASNSWSVPEGEWPTWLPGIKSQHAFLGITVNVSSTATNASILRGDGRGLCGLDVNTSGNGPPLAGDDIFAVQWEPGIYVWHSRHE